MSGDSMTFGAGCLVPFHRASWRVQREKVSRVERTHRGVRFYAEGFADPWVAASLFSDRFLRRLRELGIDPEGPPRPSTWTTT